MKIVDEMIKGAIDAHVHASPDPLRQRRMDAYNLALKAKEMGMRAIVMKCHHYGTAPVASIVNQVVPDFLLIGSIVLNSEVGGLNPEVVEIAAKAGAKIVWMPTHSSVVDIKKKRKMHHSQTDLTTAPREGISAVDSNGKLVPQMMPILQIIKDHNMILATGHISVPEIYVLASKARTMRIKFVVSHPLTTGAGSPLNLAQQIELVNKGAYIEHCYNACLPPDLATTPMIMAEHIKAVGAEHCILSTDFGQDYNPVPPEGFRMMVANMLMAGLSENELEILVKTNPAKLLDLD
jgi:hypothetical protein